MKVHIGPRDKFPLMSEINIITLIDVSLVLLIIFMVVTPFLVSSQIKINLPKAVTGLPPDTEPIKIQVTGHGTFYLEGEAVHTEDLPAMLNALLKKSKNPTVLIEADASVPFEQVITAMDAAKSQGAQKLGVAVTNPNNSKP